jgi:hypothetical protein
MPATAINYPLLTKKGLKVRPFPADNEYVGYVVPLPNHYISGMPQGAWAGESRPFLFLVALLDIFHTLL